MNEIIGNFLRRAGMRTGYNLGGILLPSFARSRTFKEDLLVAVEERFAGEATVETNMSPVSALGYYVVDIVIRHKNGRTAAIFPATSEEKALGAVLFAKELELKNIDHVVPFLVFEQTGGGKVSKDSQAKALNSELQLATWDGGSADVLDKIAKHVRQ
jgi:hypothetical protein